MKLTRPAQIRPARQTVRLLSATLAVGLAVAGVTAVTAATPAAAETVPAPLVHYTFDDVPATGRNEIAERKARLGFETSKLGNRDGIDRIDCNEDFPAPGALIM